MKKTTLLKTMLLLCALIVGGSNSVWADNVTIASGTFDGKNETYTEGWTTTGTGKTRNDCIVIYSGENITSPALNLSNYSSITISIKARRMGTLPNSKATIAVAIAGVSQGTTNATTTTATNDVDDIVFTPTASMTNVNLVFSCTNATEPDASTKGGAGINSITIIGTPKALDYTITAVANDDDMGTVEVAGTTITAKPNPGYRVKAGDGRYNVTAGTATVTDNGDNTFSVTPSSDCTVQINFEAIPTRTITVTPSADGTITVKNGETPVASGSSVDEGTVLTIEAEAGVNKEFDSWSVTGATPASPTEASTTLTVGENNITIAATFDDIITHAISWSVNGVIIDTENIKEGNAIDFAAPTSGVPAGYAFKGWVIEANKIDGTTDTEPSANYETTATSTEDITYYAVLAIENATTETATLELTSTDGYNNSYSSQTFTDNQGNEWTGDVAVSNQDSKPCIQMKTSSGGSALTSPVFSGTITSITMLCRNGSKSDRSFNFNSSSSTNTGDLGTLLVPGNHKWASELSATLKKEFNQFYLWVTDNLGFNTISVTYTATSYSGYCTTIPTFAVTVNPKAKYATFSDATDRDFSGSGITVYTAKATGSSVQLTEVTDGIVPANTGVVLYAADGATENIPAVYTTKTTLADNEMVANVTEAVVAKVGDDGKTNYILANELAGVGFYQATVGGAKLRANRAYLSTTSTGSGDAREFLGFGDGETTAIDGVKAASVENSAVYNLAGQRVAQPTKGLYIVNGKKYIVK